MSRITKEKVTALLEVIDSVLEPQPTNVSYLALRWLVDVRRGARAAAGIPSQRPTANSLEAYRWAMKAMADKRCSGFMFDTVGKDREHTLLFFVALVEVAVEEYQKCPT